MKFGIIGAMEEETRVLEANLEQKKTYQTAGVTFIHGHFHNHEVILVQSGIGKVQAALTTAILAENYRVDVIINTGSAGAIAPDLQVGDLVISSEVAYHDVDVSAFGYQIGQMAQQPARFKASSIWQKRIYQLAQKMEQHVKQGLIVTGDQFVASADKIATIVHHFPDALAAEMEGCAIAQVAIQFTIPFVVIRAMSDTANHEAAQSFDEFIVQAGKRSAELVLAVIKDTAL